jgi:phosphatidylserine/phosphatidylglycerophosphate/cardiolipin synthase-like enzyme
MINNINKVNNLSKAKEVKDYYKDGNKLEFLTNEDLTAKEIDLINQAKDTIDIAKFSFNNLLLANMLVKKAKEGVKVRVVVDPLSSNFSPSEWNLKKYIINYLKQNNVEVVEFPFVPLDNKQDLKDYVKYQLMHAKYIVIDGKKSIVSSLNWSNRAFKNIDCGLYLEGPVVDDLEKEFWFLFKRSGGKDYQYVPRAEIAGNSKASLLIADKNFSKDSYKAAVYRAVSNAKKNIFISAFVLSDPYLIKLLLDAKNRGVNIKVILDPNKSDTYDNPNYQTAKILKDNKISYRWFKPNEYSDVEFNMLHTKLMIVDDEVIVGSGNFSHKGLDINHEVGLITNDQNILKQATSFFNNIWQNNTSLEPINLPSPTPTNPINNPKYPSLALNYPIS